MHYTTGCNAPLSTSCKTQLSGFPARDKSSWADLRLVELAGSVAGPSLVLVYTGLILTPLPFLPAAVMGEGHCVLGMLRRQGRMPLGKWGGDYERIWIYGT